MFWRCLIFTLICTSVSPALATPGWQTYRPDALPPAVLSGYPEAALTLVNAQSTTAPTVAEAQGLVGAVVAEGWSSARWFLHLNADDTEAAAVSPDGLRVLLLHVSGTNPLRLLAFTLSFKRAAPQGVGFTSVPGVEALWTRTLPEVPSTFSSTPCPDGVNLEVDGVVVTSPANFPSPAGKKKVLELHCTGLDVVYGKADAFLRPITIRASSWQRAWAVADTLSILSVNYGVRLNLSAGRANVTSSSYFPQDAVIAFRAGQGELQPLLFQARVSPRPLADGSNQFYQRAGVGGFTYQFISVDTYRGIVQLIPRSAMPDR